MTTRYAGRIERLASRPMLERQPEAPRGLVEKRGPGDAKPTSAEALARLLDTHHWLRVRKNVQ